MSDQIWLAVIAAATLIILVILLGHRFKGAKAKVGGEGLEAEIQTHSPAPLAEPNRPPEAASPTPKGLIVRDVDMIGEQLRISAHHDNAEVSKIRQVGKDLSLTVGSEKPPESKG
jgi:hypothetical protein